MNPIFKNYSDSAAQLAQKITEEGIAHPIFTYINPDAYQYCQKVNPSLVPFSNLNLSLASTLIILDDGSTSAVEYNEFTDRIHQQFSTTKVIIAIPVIPESEKPILQSACDTLIYLHADTLFFSVNQFYQEAKF